MHSRVRESWQDGEERDRGKSFCNDQPVTERISVRRIRVMREGNSGEREFAPTRMQELLPSYIRKCFFLPESFSSPKTFYGSAKSLFRSFLDLTAPEEACTTKNCRLRGRRQIWHRPNKPQTRSTNSLIDLGMATKKC